ncbi:hypothetical protein ACN20G_23440 [Streptomyces sp. BI20]|uniref:hypothetical protein n=1 Tax=Streptomyces sp. BI20 TaxID=3403460 RepID=UPI003C71626F
MDESALWSQGDYLLARLSDSMEMGNYLFLRANSEDYDEPPPMALPRPGEPVEEEHTEELFASGDEVADWFMTIGDL